MEDIETAGGAREAFVQGVEAFRRAGMADVPKDARMRFMVASRGVMREGDYALIDDALAALDPAALSASAILTLLRTHFTARLVLPAWTAFRDGTADALDARGEPTPALLTGLWAPEGDRMEGADAVREDPAGAFRESWGAISDGGRDGFPRPHLDRAMLAVRHLLVGAQHAPLDAALAAADPACLPDQAAITLLRACRAAREELPSWDGLRDRIGDFHHGRGSGAQRLVADLGWAPPGPAPEAGAP